MSDFIESLNIIGLKPKNLLVILIVVGVFTCGNIWLRRDDPPLGLVQYSDFGFTFNHDSDGFVERGSISGEPPSYSDGRYTVSYGTDIVHQVGVFWFSPDVLAIPLEDDILRSSLEMVFQMAESEGNQLSRDEEYLVSEKNSHEMVFQYFDVHDSGMDLPGVGGTWQCDDRILFFYTIYTENPEKPETDKTKLTEIWNKALDQMQCN